MGNLLFYQITYISLLKCYLCYGTKFSEHNITIKNDSTKDGKRQYYDLKPTNPITDKSNYKKAVDVKGEIPTTRSTIYTMKSVHWRTLSLTTIDTPLIFHRLTDSTPQDTPSPKLDSTKDKIVDKLIISDNVTETEKKKKRVRRGKYRHHKSKIDNTYSPGITSPNRNKLTNLTGNETNSGFINNDPHNELSSLASSIVGLGFIPGIVLLFICCRYFPTLVSECKHFIYRRN